MRLALCVALCSACGGGGNLSGAVSGTLGGSSWSATGAYSDVPPHDTCSDSRGYDVLRVYLSSHLNSAFLATAANNCTFKASSTDLGIDIWAVNAPQPHTFATGSYAIDPQSVAAFTQRYNGQCAHLFPNLLASSGTITLTAIDAAHIAGTIDVTFPGSNGGTIRGTFDAPRGTAPYNACDGFGLSGGTPGPGCPAVTCQP